MGEKLENKLGKKLEQQRLGEKLENSCEANLKKVGGKGWTILRKFLLNPTHLKIAIGRLET